MTTPIAELSDLLSALGCEVAPEILANWTRAQRGQIATWAEALAFGEPVHPVRPGLLADYDCRRCRRCGCTDAVACPAGCCWHGPDLCSECVAPGTLIDLRYWLERRPHCRLTGPDGVACDVAFDRFQGGLWFRGSDGREVYLPIRCGPAGDRSGTGLRFDDGGFDLEESGKVSRVEYCNGPNS